MITAADIRPSRVLNVALDGLPDTAVYVGRLTKFGRPTEFGNPFGQLPRKEAISHCRAYLRQRADTDPAFRQRLISIAGRTVACHCSPAPCHGYECAAAADHYFLEDYNRPILVVSPVGEAGIVVTCEDDLNAVQLSSLRGLHVHLVEPDADEVRATLISTSLKFSKDPEIVELIRQHLPDRQMTAARP